MMTMLLIACLGSREPALEPSPIELPVQPEQVATASAAEQQHSPDSSSTAESGSKAKPDPLTTLDDPFYYHHRLGVDDLEGKSLRELSLIRNTIYARAGQPFRKRWLADRFEKLPWYKARSEGADLSMLTELDVHNANLVGGYEASLTREQLEDRARAIGDRYRYDEELKLELALISVALGEWWISDDFDPADGDEDDPEAQRAMIQKFLYGKGLRSPLADPTMLEQKLEEKQLKNLSRRDLRLLRNTVFARRGRTFESESLSKYFDQKVWYKPDRRFSDARLTEIDRHNVALIVQVENDEFGGMLSEEEHARFDGMLAGA